VTLPDWTWFVVVRLADRDGEQALHARAPTRAAAKRNASERVESGGGTVTEWVRTYIPRPSWDCPECHTHESLTKLPNLRGSHDWECMVCGLLAYGEPMDWGRLDRSFVDGREKRPTTDSAASKDATVRQTTLPASTDGAGGEADE